MKAIKKVGVEQDEKVGEDWGWEDYCPLCGSVNKKGNKCGLCGFKWKKEYVYFSGGSIADWEEWK